MNTKPLPPLFSPAFSRDSQAAGEALATGLARLHANTAPISEAIAAALAPILRKLPDNKPLPLPTFRFPR